MDTNTDSNCSLKKCTYVHPDLKPLPNHFNKLFNAQWLRNIRLGLTTSQNTAHTHQIIKDDLDYLHLYNFSTQWPSIQEILEYKLITYKHAFKSDRISPSFNIHPQKQNSTHQIISEEISSKIFAVTSMSPYNLGLLQNIPSHPIGCHLIQSQGKTLLPPCGTSSLHT